MYSPPQAITACAILCMACGARSELDAIESDAGNDASNDAQMTGMMDDAGQMDAREPDLTDPPLPGFPQPVRSPIGQVTDQDFNFIIDWRDCPERAYFDDVQDECRSSAPWAQFWLMKVSSNWLYRLTDRSPVVQMTNTIAMDAEFEHGGLSVRTDASGNADMFFDIGGIDFSTRLYPSAVQRDGDVITINTGLWNGDEEWHLTGKVQVRDES